MAKTKAVVAKLKAVEKSLDRLAELMVTENTVSARVHAMVCDASALIVRARLRYRDEAERDS